MVISGIPFSVILNSLGLVLDIIGGYFLTKGLLLSNELIDEISATKWDGNLEAKKMYLSNRRDAYWGLRFLIGGFLLQFASQFLGA